MDDFLSMPPYIWKSIFSVLKVLGAGLLLALFATKYQKRKEIELQVKANILKLQLETYVRINTLFSEIQSMIAPPLRKEACFEEIIDAEKFGIRYMEYSSFFDSMEKFDDYYIRLNNLHQAGHIYMQYQVEQKFSEFMSYMSELKMFLDAFCDTEHAKELHLPEKRAEEQIQFAYQMVGICVQRDMTRFYGQMDQLLAYEVSHISLSYRSHYLKSTRDCIVKFLQEFLETYLADKGWKGRLAKLFYYKVFFRCYGNSTLLTFLPIIMTQLAYIHYSHSISPELWYDNPEKSTQLMKEFYTVFKSNLHHG